MAGTPGGRYKRRDGGEAAEQDGRRAAKVARLCMSVANGCTVDYYRTREVVSFTGGLLFEGGEVAREQPARPGRGVTSIPLASQRLEGWDGEAL